MEDTAAMERRNGYRKNPSGHACERSNLSGNLPKKHQNQDRSAGIQSSNSTDGERRRNRLLYRPRRQNSTKRHQDMGRAAAK